MNLRLLLGLVITFAMVSCGGDMVIEEPNLPEPEEALDAKDAETGCTDEAALNYSTLAIEDDGSCKFTEKKQRSMFVKFTGTWCWACGDYGASVLNGMHDFYKDNAVIFEAHKDDEMSNAISHAWRDYWPHRSTPSFVANSSLIEGSVSATAKATIDAANSQQPTVTFLGEFTADGAKFKGHVFAQAEQELTGTYRMGIYPIGQDLIAKQQAGKGDEYPDWDYVDIDNDGKGVYPDYIHHAILFGEVNNEPFGQVIFDGSAAANEVKLVEFSVDYAAAWSQADHMDLAVIVWKENGNKFEFVNATHVSNQ